MHVNFVMIIWGLIFAHCLMHYQPTIIPNLSFKLIRQFFEVKFIHSTNENAKYEVGIILCTNLIQTSVICHVNKQQ